jgi:hypothetical protein
MTPTRIQWGRTIGTPPITSATNLSGAFRNTEHSGFLGATKAFSTADPATRDLYVLNSHSATSLTEAPDDL